MAIRGIYEPRGRAREYAPLACELWTGCTHGCKYCYVPKAYRRDRSDFHEQARPRTGILQELRRQAESASPTLKTTPVLFCFSADPYQPAEREASHTHLALEIMAEHDIPVHILTKGGHLAMRDFDLLEREGCAFGTTLLFSNDTDRKEWEPEAATVRERIDAIEEAYTSGIPTFVSAEPIIYPQQVEELICELGPAVKEWRFGKLNHMTGPLAIRWNEWLPALIKAARYVGARAMVKESLEEFIPDHMRESLVRPGESLIGQAGWNQLRSAD
jgi:DNA repair photolyase